MATDINTLESQAETKYGLPSGILTSVRKQETGGSQEYLDNPEKPHYPTGYTKSGVKSSAYGPYGILESTAKQPGYGVDPLTDKSLESQTDFAAKYLAGRIKHAGSVEAGLAGYGEGKRYADQVLSRIGQTNMATQVSSSSSSPSTVDNLAAQSTANNNAAAIALENLTKQQNDVITSAQQTLLGTVEDATLVQQTKDLATAQAANRTLDFATKIGANQGAANEALSKLIDQTNKLVQQQDAVAERIKYGSTPRNLYTNPIRFAADFLLMPQHQQKYNIISKQVESSKNQLKWIQDATQNQRQTENAMAQPITLESASASARLVRRDVEMQLAKLDLEKLKTNADNVLATTRVRNDNMSIGLRRRDQEIQEENLGIQRSNQALQAQALQIQLKDKVESEAAKQGFLEAVNLGREINGSLPAFRNYAELDTYMKVNPTQKQSIATQYNSGMSAKTIGQTTLAGTPHSALSYIAQTGAKLDPGRQMILDTAMSAYQDASANPEIAKLLKNKATATDTVNKVIQDKFVVYNADITKGGASNPYAAPPLAALLHDPEIAKTYFATNVLKALSDSGVQELPFTSAISVLIKDMNAGKVSMQQVDSELGFLASKISFYNNDLRRYQATAGVPNMKQVNVPVTIPTDPGILNLLDQMVSPTAAPTKTIKLDLANPVKRSEFLNKVKAASLKIPVTTSKTGVQ